MTQTQTPATKTPACRQARCRSCSAPFTIAPEDEALFDQISPTFNDHRFQIPTPTLCPPCRQQLRMSFRNERKLYKVKSAFSGKEIISMFSEDKGYKVVDRDEWWGDSWNPTDYGRDFDFTKTFAEQFRVLYKDVPHLNLQNVNTENSYYTNYAINQKNSYLIFGGSYNEDCLYGKFVTYCTNCVDVLSCHACEVCYEGIASERCYNCRFFANSRSTHDCTFVEDCTGCANCIACFGLKFKKNCFLNRQLSPSEFEKAKKEYETLTPEKIAYLSQELEKLKTTLPRPHAHMYNCEDCTGEFVLNCKNCHFAFDARESEDCKYIYFCPKAIHSQDCTFNAPFGPEFCYNLCSSVALKSSMANFLFWYGDSVFYCMECHHTNNCFGCVSMRHNNYCVLNKQYERSEYERLVARIIEHMKTTGEWGEFFTPQTGAFAYNETIAQEYFPLTKEEALKKGWTWKDEEPPTAPTPESSYTPPTNIKDVGNDILDKQIYCSVSGKPFKIVKEELAFYRRLGLPIPQISPAERHYARVAKHNALTLFERTCDKCKKPIQTVYRKEAPFKVYCEECYLKEVY